MSPPIGVVWASVSEFISPSACGEEHVVINDATTCIDDDAIGESVAFASVDYVTVDGVRDGVPRFVPEGCREDLDLRVVRNRGIALGSAPDLLIC